MGRSVHLPLAIRMFSEVGTILFPGICNPEYYHVTPGNKVCACHGGGVDVQYFLLVNGVLGP
jgi:hypothetical protein